MAKKEGGLGHFWKKKERKVTSPALGMDGVASTLESEEGLKLPPEVHWRRGEGAKLTPEQLESWKIDVGKAEALFRNEPDKLRALLRDKDLTDDLREGLSEAWDRLGGNIIE